MSASPAHSSSVVRGGGGEGRDGADGADGEGVDLGKRDPFKLFTDEVKNSYLRCSYKWCFHHIPTLLDRVRKGSLEGSLIWAILALAIRYVVAFHWEIGNWLEETLD